MNPHTHVTTATATPVPVKVAAALADLHEQFRTASVMPTGTDTEHAVRAVRLALVCARRAGWWRVLERHTYSPAAGVPLVYGEAVIKAAGDERRAARFWRDAAADWHARARGDRHGSGTWAMWDHIQPRGQYDERGAVA